MVLIQFGLIFENTIVFHQKSVFELISTLLTCIRKSGENCKVASTFQSQEFRPDS